MNTVRQLSRQDSTSRSSDEDSRDFSDAKYINLKNKQGSQKSTESEIEDNNTVADYINPAYRATEEDDHTYDTPKVNYDSLSYPKDKREHQTKPSPVPRRPTPQPRADITKPPEEFEMGVSNYGYHNDNTKKQDSWNKSLSGFSPYAVDTPIGGPVDSRGSSLSVPEKRLSGSSKHSDYSFVSDGNENPYAAPSEKISAYDTIPGQDLAQKGRLPPPRQGTKKTNLAYETAVITKVQSKTVKSDQYKEGYEPEDDHSNCCQMIFIVLVGVIALIALVVVFLVVFGTISVKKCKECDGGGKLYFYFSIFLYKNIKKSFL